MEILFKNKTKYTKNVYQNFLNFHQTKFGTNYNFITIVTILLLCFCITITVKNSYYFIAFIFIISLFAFCFYRFLYPVKKIEKEIKTEKFEKEKFFIFTFYEKHFIISDRNSSEQIKYCKLYKVYETETFFYLYINKNQAFILDKSTFLIGNSSNFLKFLRKRRNCFSINFTNKCNF